MNKKHNFLGIYYTYFIYGFISMILSAILPYLSSEYGLIYSQSGLLLSFVSIGNFSASIIGGMMINKFGRKKSVVFLSSFLVFVPFGIILNSYPIWLFICSFFLGLGLGAINYFDNLIVNDQAPGEGKYLSLLHTFYAIGAFLTPLFILLILNITGNWKVAVFLTAFIALSAVIVYIVVPIEKNPSVILKETKGDNTALVYYKNPVYYLILIIFFLYVGAEQTINGWLVTYLTKTNIVSDSVAQTLLSLFWVVIILGRIIAAKISSQAKKSSIIMFCSFSITITFAVFLFTNNSIIASVAILLLGLFCGPIYPMCLASAGPIVYNNPKALTFLMISAGLGAASFPYILGKVSDSTGILGGMITILLAFILLSLMSILLKITHKEEVVN